MITTTGVLRADGTRSRRYLCNEHRFRRCTAGPIDALIVDHVFVAHLNRFLGAPEDAEPYRPSPGFPRELIRGEPDNGWERVEPLASVAAELKLRIQGALADRDNELAERLLDELVDHRERLHRLTHEPRSHANIQSSALSEDPLTLLLDFYMWSGKDLAGQLRGKPAQTERLNRVLRRWFIRIMLRTTARGIEIAPLPGPSSATTNVRARTIPTPAYVAVDTWRIVLQVAGYGHRGKDPWPRSEIIHALKTWAAAHGRPPRARDWEPAAAEHPNYSTVFDRFGGWHAALRAAGLQWQPVDRHSHRDHMGRFAAGSSGD